MKSLPIFKNKNYLGIYYVRFNHYYNIIYLILHFVKQLLNRYRILEYCNCTSRKCLSKKYWNQYFWIVNEIRITLHINYVGRGHLWIRLYDYSIVCTCKCCTSISDYYNIIIVRSGGRCCDLVRERLA